MCRELHAAQRDVDRRLVDACAALTDAQLEQPVAVQRSKGVMHETATRLLAHLFQHQIHHRGQAHAMLAGTRVKPPQLDEFFCANEAHLRARRTRGAGLFGGGDLGCCGSSLTRPQVAISGHHAVGLPHLPFAAARRLRARARRRMTPRIRSSSAAAATIRASSRPMRRRSEAGIRAGQLISAALAFAPELAFPRSRRRRRSARARAARDVGADVHAQRGPGAAERRRRRDRRQPAPVQRIAAARGAA